MAQGGFDPRALLGDPPGELDERLQPASPCPRQPRVEQLERVLEARSVVDLAQLFFEQVGAVDRGVELLNPGELGLLAFGQVLGLLPEREPGALEIFAELLVAGAARLVPDLAADLVQRVGRCLDDVPRVKADLGVRAALRDRPGDPLGVVAGHELDLLAALFPQQIQELLDRFAVAAERRPHQPAGVMVDHDREVFLTLADRDLVEPKLRESREQVAAGLRVGAHALADPPDRPPRDPHQLTDRGLGRVHRKPCGLVIEGAREPGVVARPRHRRHHHAVPLATDPRRVGLQEAERRAEIQRPPPPATLPEVVARAAASTVRAAIPLAIAGADRDHDRTVLLVDRLDDRLLQSQQPRPRADAYASAAHAATAPFQRS
jgi:hypothetical protein